MRALLDYENKDCLDLEEDFDNSQIEGPTIEELRAIEAEEELKLKKKSNNKDKQSVFVKPTPVPTKKNSEATLADLFNSAVPEVVTAKMEEPVSNVAVVDTAKVEEPVSNVAVVDTAKVTEPVKEVLSDTGSRKKKRVQLTTRKIGTSGKLSLRFEENKRVSLYGHIGKKDIATSDLIRALEEFNKMSRADWCRLYDIAGVDAKSKVRAILKVLSLRGVDVSKYEID